MTACRYRCHTWLPLEQSTPIVIAGVMHHPLCPVPQPPLGARLSIELSPGFAEVYFDALPALLAAGKPPDSPDPMGVISEGHAPRWARAAALDPLFGRLGRAPAPPPPGEALVVVRLRNGLTTVVRIPEPPAAPAPQAVSPPP